MPAPTFESRKDDYARLWASMESRPSKAADIDATAQKIVGKKTRYSAVSAATGVPWYVVGLIHAMEAGCNFACHLHNGDSLARRTVQVPRGRPVEGEPPFQWKDSAIDAVRYDGLDDWSDWSIEGICYCLERFNGWGYVRFHPEVNSPYLWSGSNHYARGKYVADGQWSSSAVSGQSGALPILKRIMELDAEVRPTLGTETPEPVEEQVTDPAVAFPRTPQGAMQGGIGGAVASFKEKFNFAKLNQMIEQGSQTGQYVRRFINWIWAILFGGTAAGTGAYSLVDQSKPAAVESASWASQHPILLAIICSSAVAAVLLVVGYFFAKKIEKALVAAWQAGLHKTTGQAIAAAQTKEA